MRAKLRFHSLPFMGKDIVPTDFAKDLGVILDSNLTYNEYIIKVFLSIALRIPTTHDFRVISART